MLSNKKYRINNMSKDLNLKSKDLVDLLAKHGFTGRTHMAVLEPMDFSVILNELTSEKQISSIDDYLNGVIKIERPVEKVPSEATKSKTPSGDKTDSIKDTVTVKTPEIAAQQQGHRPAQRQRPAQQQGQRPAQQQKQRQTVQQQGQILINGTLQTITKTVEQTTPSRSRSQQQFTRPQPVQPKQPKHQKQTQQYVPRSASDQPVPTVITQAETRTIGSARVVNTRSSNVDLARYDDKVEKLVPEAAKDVGVEKQKLKKQNTRDSAPKNRGTSRGRDSVSRGRDMKTAGRDASSRGRFDREKSAMERLKKQELEKARKAQLRVSIPDTILVSELASRLKVTASDVVKRLVSLGVMANVNQTIDYDTAYLVADELGAKVTREVVVTIEDKLFSEKETEEGNLVERAPVVVVMGHVDHGKTSLLDKIRNAHVTEGEAGGITQHIGAYRVKVKDKEITFLDTPGHAAFTAMRARGAKATDIAILVVAADDGIMPQTIEAINHAKEAELDIIVAINKMDKPNANPDTVMQGLTNYDLIPEAWGGDVICVPVSAITGFGIDDLLENILILAEMKEYKSNPERRARGIVIESKLDKGRGPVASLLIQNGTLNNGDVIIAGTAVGRVRSMSDERGNQVKSAGPSVPVEISGLDEIPAAGDEFNVVEDERMARELADQRRIKLKEEEFNTNSKVNLDDLFSAISEGVKELKIIVKADVDGSAEAVKSSLEKLSNDEVKVRIIHIGVGGITENDVMLASASNAIIVGFNVRPDKNAIDTAERQSVDIRTYRIIYECIEEIEAALKGMLAPTYKENILGHVEVRQTINVPNVGTIAGSYVQDGKVVRSAQRRVLRDSVVIFVDKISS
ncbi:MAG: translation initiation factor IF-2, partial [Eubacteriales bacterium]|nr:translation initiation factor IF-2 [Eubacteriales bacterium]